MNAKVHPLVAVLVVFLTLAAIGVWLWGTGEAKRIGGPAELRADPRGHLYIQIQNQLLEHDADGEFLQRHDLSRLGVDPLLGGMGFFSNGDILLRRGPDPRTLAQNIRAYRRQTNDQSLIPVSPDAGLYRCNLETAACELFGAEAIDFKAAYGIFIDWRNDNVYISDTTRHLLRKYAANGEPLATPARGFKFPNHLLLHDESLLVANTNYHEIRKVDPGNENFGEELQSFNTAIPMATAAGQIWPSHVARINDGWWVNNMRNNMSDGGIYIFDDAWQFTHKASLPAGADPISILPFHGEVLISDWKNDRVYRLSANGDLLNDFSSAGLEQVLAESRAMRLQYRIYSYAGIALFLLVLVAIFIRILVTRESTQLAKSRAFAKNESNTVEAIWLEPDPKAVRKITIALRLLTIMTIVFAVLVLILAILSGNYLVGLSFLLPVSGLAGICAIISWASRANIGTAIGINENTLTLQDHKGRRSTCTLRDAIYDLTAIATPDVALFLGQPHMSVYDRQTLNDQVFPRLKDARRVSVWAMQKALFSRRHPQGLSLAMVLIGVIAGTAWILLDNLIRTGAH